MAKWSTCFSLTVTYCIYYSCGGRNDFTGLYFQQFHIFLKPTTGITRLPHIKKAHHPQTFGCNEIQYMKNFHNGDNFRSSYYSKGKNQSSISRRVVFVTTLCNFQYFFSYLEHLEICLKCLQQQGKVQPLYLCCKHRFPLLATATKTSTRPQWKKKKSC